MKKLLMVLMALVFASGCAGTLKQVPATKEEAFQEKGLRKTDNCATTDYQSDGKVFIQVWCPGRVIHVVNKLKPDTDYAILIGNDPIVIVKPSSEGIIVFVNQFGEDVELIPEIPDEELKKIKTNPPAHKATADKPAYAPGASADKGGE